MPRSTGSTVWRSYRTARRTSCGKWSARCIRGEFSRPIPSSRGPWRSPAMSRATSSETGGTCNRRLPFRRSWTGFNARAATIPGSWRSSSSWHVWSGGQETTRRFCCRRGKRVSRTAALRGFCAATRRSSPCGGNRSVSARSITSWIPARENSRHGHRTSTPPGERRMRESRSEGKEFLSWAAAPTASARDSSSIPAVLCRPWRIADEGAPR